MNKKLLSGLLAILEISGTSMAAYASESEERILEQKAEKNQQQNPRAYKISEGIYRDDFGNEYQSDLDNQKMILVNLVSNKVPEYLELNEIEPINWDKEYEKRVQAEIETEKSEWGKINEGELKKKKEEISERILNEIDEILEMPIPLYKVVIPSQKLNDKLEDENGLAYMLNEENNTAQVFKCKNKTISGVKIPEFLEYNGKLYKVTSIGQFAFEDCSALTSINIPESVTEIEDAVFNGCSSLTSIDIPQNVAFIGDSAFEYCSSLTSINIPNNVSHIGLRAFWGCTALTSITIPNRLTSIGEFAFKDCSSLASITIPNSVTMIDKWAFDGCSALTSINLPQSITQIGEEAFKNCIALTSINIPQMVTKIYSSTFKSCKSLTSITIPNGVISIDEEAFAGCRALTSINIPNSVTMIGTSTFAGCNLLREIRIPNSTEIADNAFENCPANIIRY